MATTNYQGYRLETNEGTFIQTTLAYFNNKLTFSTVCNLKGENPQPSKNQMRSIIDQKIKRSGSN